MGRLFYDRKYRHIGITVLIILFITGVLGALLYRQNNHERVVTESLALKEAVSTFNSDLNFRRWMTMMGGVYIPVSEEYGPNPHLSNVFEQTIESPSGRELTLMNPAWAIRSLNEFCPIEQKAFTHITSRNLLRPENAPDHWETDALESFSIGAEQAKEISLVGDIPYFRYMEPMFVEEGCLKCHGHQGYSVGDLRGGISVSVLYTPYLEIQNRKIFENSLTMSLIYLGVLLSVILGSIAIYRRNSLILQTRTLLMNSNRELEREVLNSSNINEKLELEVQEHRKVESELNDAFGIINRSASVVFLWKNDKFKTVEFVSENIRHLLGYESREIIGKSDRFISSIHPDDSLNVQESFEDISSGFEASPLAPFRILSRDGEVKWVSIRRTYRKDSNRNITHIEGIVTDITKNVEAELDKEKLQAQLDYKNKMDGLGQLAGGIAHDFNNILHGIASSAQLLQMPQKGLGNDALKYVDMILKASEKAAGLTEKLLTYSRKDKVHFKAVDLHKIIDECITILDSSLQKTIELVIDKQARNPIVKGDRSGIENALFNLILNAAHAVGKNGRIHITSRNMEYKESFKDSCLFEVKPGNYCEIEIRDTGCGIDRETQKKMFEPFFTTKGPGEGTGLGLTTVYSIIRNHNGSIIVNSTIGEGTSFRIAFLSLEEKIEAVSKPDAVVSGAGTVLFVDDDESNRLLVSEILDSLGYHVLLASNGQEGVEQYKKHHPHVEVVLLDMVMPVMDGREAFEKLREFDPECRIIISSGYTKNESIDDMLADQLNGFIMKPFRIAELSQVLENVLKSP
jgi:PAS domain S-box-containing protein